MCLKIRCDGESEKICKIFLGSKQGLRNYSNRSAGLKQKDQQIIQCQINEHCKSIRPCQANSLAQTIRAYHKATQPSIQIFY